MWRSKKLIIGILLGIVVVGGSVGGAVLANSGNDDANPGEHIKTLLERVCEIYKEKTGIAMDQEALQESLRQARSEMAIEGCESNLKPPINRGGITEKEVDRLEKWQERKQDLEKFKEELKRWHQERPDVRQFKKDLKQWLQSRPDIEQFKEELQEWQDNKLDMEQFKEELKQWLDSRPKFPSPRP
ncbi:hypothetical protein ACFLWZ_03385 [Chloroflexota bacterium]